MVAVLLTILKILGIILLVLLGIILMVVLLVLFVPIRYKIKVHRKTEDGTPIVADVRVTYLAYILNVAFSYPEAAYVRVRVFCFTVFRSDKSKGDAESSSSEKGKRKEKKGKKKDKAQDDKGEDKIRAEDAPKSEETETTEATAEAGQKEALKEEDEKDNSEGIEDAERGDGKEENKILAFLRKIWDVLKNIRYTIVRICDKIKDIVNNIRYYVEILQSDRFDRGFQVCKGQLIALLKMLRPRKLTGELLIGTGDPASTGQVMAAYGILYPLLGNHIEVVPDFERQIVEGSLFIKGKITIFVLVKCAWIIYFNKDIRKLIKLFKREAA